MSKQKSDSLRIDTSIYQRNHGGKPRGRGSWAFCPSNRYNEFKYLDYTLFSPYLSYVEAKAWLSEQGVSGVWLVCP